MQLAPLPALARQVLIQTGQVLNGKAIQTIVNPVKLPDGTTIAVVTFDDENLSPGIFSRALVRIDAGGGVQELLRTGDWVQDTSSEWHEVEIIWESIAGQDGNVVAKTTNSNGNHGQVFIDSLTGEMTQIVGDNQSFPNVGNVTATGPFGFTTGIASAGSIVIWWCDVLLGVCEPMLQEGAAAPGLPDLVLRLLGDPVVFDDWLVMRAGLEGPGVDSSNDLALLFIDRFTGTVNLVARKGDALSDGIVRDFLSKAFSDGIPLVTVQLSSFANVLARVEPTGLIPLIGPGTALPLPDGTTGSVVTVTPLPEGSGDDGQPSTDAGDGFSVVVGLEGGGQALVDFKCIDDSLCHEEPTCNDDGECLLEAESPLIKKRLVQADEVVTTTAEAKKLFVQPDEVETTTEGNPSFSAFLATPNADGTPNLGPDGFAGTSDDDAEFVSADWSVVGDIGFLPDGSTSGVITTVLVPELPDDSTEETGQVVANADGQEASSTVTVRRGREFFVVPAEAVLEVGETQTFEAFLVSPNADGTPNFGPDGVPATSDDDAWVMNPRWSVEGDIGTVVPTTANATTEFTATTPGTGQVVAQGVFREALAKVTVLGDAQLEYLDSNDETVDQVTLFEPSTPTSRRIAAEVGALNTLGHVQNQNGTAVSSLEDQVDGLIPSDKRYRITGPGGEPVVVTLTSRTADGTVLDVCDIVLKSNGNGQVFSGLIVAVSPASGIPPSHSGDLHIVLAEDGGQLTAEGDGFQAGTADVVSGG